MDTSDTYIKMSDHPKIQGQWKPQEGDCFSFVGDIHILADYEIDALNKREVDIDCYNEVVKLMGGHFVDHWNECRDGFTWLPRQDEIQKMMKEENLVELVDRFNNFFERMVWTVSKIRRERQAPWTQEKGERVMEFKSMEQLWLAFYMYEKHGLAWSDEKWIKK